MRDHVVKHPHVIELAKQAMIDCDIEPDIKPIRGGTDGAQLSYRGLPCLTCLPAVITSTVNTNLFHWKAWNRQFP